MNYFFQLYFMISFGQVLTMENYVENFRFGERIETDFVRNNHKLYVFDFDIKGDIQHCITWCKARKQCKFINFDRNLNLCYHIGVDNKTSFSFHDFLEQKSGLVFGDKRDWNLTDYGICDDCNDLGVCSVNNEEKYSNCQNSGCRPPGKEINAILHGNMFAIGNKVEYECKAGYKTNSTAPFRSTCRENGTWSSSGLRCLPDAVFNSNIHEFENNFYKFGTVKRNWSYAYDECNQQKLHLVDIKTHAEQDFIKDTILANYAGYCYWTGGVRREDSVLVWQDGQPLSTDSYYWRLSQPNNYNGQQGCVLLVEQDYKWNDKRCSRECFAICEL